MVLVRKDDTWCVSLCHTLDDMRKSTFSDVIIKAEGDDVLKAHTCILAAASPVLKTRLLISQHYLYIPKISKRTWEIVLQFVYTGNLEISQLLEVHGVLRTAKQLKMTGLTALCMRLLDDNKQTRCATVTAMSSHVVKVQTSQDGFHNGSKSNNAEHGMKEARTSDTETSKAYECSTTTKEANKAKSENESAATDDVLDGSGDAINTTENDTTKSDQQNPVSCKICGKFFRKISYLHNHMFQHTGERPYKCWDCGLAFTLQSNLSRHKAIHTGMKSYACTLCSKTFSRRDTLRRHEKVRHNDEKPFACPQCGKRFKLKHEVPVHMRIHMDDKPYVCEICGKTFSRMNYLVAHRCTHSDARPFRCPNCPKSFKDRASVNRHQLTHSKLKWHMCSTCGKMYPSKSRLINHEYTHRGLQKHYPCVHCGKEFTSKSHMARHVHTMHEKLLGSAATVKQVVLDKQTT